MTTLLLTVSVSSTRAEDDQVEESEREGKVIPIFQVVKFPVSLPNIYHSIVRNFVRFFGLAFILHEQLGRKHCQKCSAYCKIHFYVSLSVFVGNYNRICMKKLH